MIKEIILEMKNITKIFPGVVALEDVNFQLNKGEVHILLGENGAGKSTLIKTISGAYRQDRGKIFFEGKEIEIHSPKYAMDIGISTIYQEFNLVSELTVCQNIFLGREIYKGIFIDWGKMRSEADKLFKMLEVDISSTDKISSLSVSKMQMVEIAKALYFNSKIVILDEPTSALTNEDKERLFKIIRDLKKKGIGIIYISHRLEELFEIGDRVTVLRDGQYVSTHSISEVTTDSLIQMMVGREIVDQFPRNYCNPGEVVLEVRNLSSKGNFKNVSFQLHKGEILGISGLIGAGRTELVKAIFGALKIESGQILLGGKEFKPKPNSSVEKGIAFIPEDRKNEGLCLKLSVHENMIHSSLNKLFKKYEIIRNKRVFSLISNYIDDLKIKTPHAEQQVQFLSGGNQQKVVLAKWLINNSEIYIFDEPTRGIDVGAKHEFHKIMDNLVNDGAAVIMVSSEMPEVVGMSDRILVMKEGRIAGEYSREEATQDKILEVAL